jgi:hypothetical protein
MRAALRLGDPITATATLRLNVLPVVFPKATTPETVHHVARTPEREQELRQMSGEGTRFHVYSSYDRVYLWPHSGSPLPDEVDLSQATAVLPEALPPEVVAFAAREAVVDRLIDRDGFEKLPGSFKAPVRLFRRKHNLAARALGRELQEETGMYPLLSVQGIVLPAAAEARARAAIVLDAGLVNRLDIPLADLADAGIDLGGMRVVWRHADLCRCGFPDAKGSAGLIAGGDARPFVRVTQNHETRDIAAECLGPRVSRQALESYFTTLFQDAGHLHRKLDAAIASYEETDAQWRLLEQTRTVLTPLRIFANTDVELAEPVAAALDGAPPLALAPLPEPTLNFRYGNPALATGAAVGLRQHGPYDAATSVRQDALNALVLCPQEYAVEGRRLVGGLGGVGNFPGMEERYALREFKSELELFAGRNATDYREAALRAAQPRQDRARPDIVFLVTRHDDRFARRGENCYFMGKATLANVALPSQAVTVETLRQPDNSWQWSVQSVALQTYAKVGNIPFVLHDAGGVRELVIGVGRSDLVDPQQGYVKQIFGAAACFRQDGDFLYAGSTVPIAGHDDYEDMLAELLTNFIERFENEQGSLDRLVLHIFKKTGRRELSAVERALEGREIPFGLLHVNRDTPLWLVTEDADRHEPAAPGALVALADHDRLLMTGEASRKKRNAHPLRLTLDRNSTFRDMDWLATQIQGFTATSWRGFHRTNEPSTILYGRLLAEKVTQLVPYGFRPELAVAMGDRPWFL